MNIKRRIFFCLGHVFPIWGYQLQGSLRSGAGPSISPRQWKTGVKKLNKATFLDFKYQNNEALEKSIIFNKNNERILQSCSKPVANPCPTPDEGHCTSRLQPRYLLNFAWIKKHFETIVKIKCQLKPDVGPLNGVIV